MGHVGVFKAPDHMDNGVSGADVGEKLVSQALTLGSALYKTCNIHKLDDGRRHLLGLMQLRQPGKPLIRHGNHAHIGVNGAERIVVGGNTGIGNGVKQSGLAYIGQTDNT